MLDNSNLQPWVELIGYDYADELDLHDPYNHIDNRLQLKVLSTIGLEPSRKTGMAGIYTSLSSERDGGIIRLDLEDDPTSLYQRPGKPNGTGTMTLIDCRDRFLRQLCLLLSDVMCIVVDNIHQAARELFRFVDAVDLSNVQRRQWPWIIIIDKSDPIDMDSESSPRRKAMFDAYIGARWDTLGRSKGKYTRILQLFLQRTQLWPHSKNICALWNKMELLLNSDIFSQRGHQFLGDITAQVERYCLNPPVPGSTAARAQYWPGKDHLAHSSLIDWVTQINLNTNADVTNCIAEVFAQLFLRDSQFVAHCRDNLNWSEGANNVTGKPETSCEELFLSFYRPICVKAWLAVVRQSQDFLINDLDPFLEHILYYLMSQSNAQERDKIRQASTKAMKYLTKSSFCSSCLWDRKPLILLPCGHGICERDMWMIALRASKFSTLHFLRSCPACEQTVNRWFLLRPLQAGYRVAAFDGGGTLGVVSLITFLHTLEPLPKLHPYHYIDQMGGTSAGSINAAALGMRKLPLETCIAIFLKAAPKIFQKEKGFVGRLTWLLRLIKKGAIYQSTALHRTLRDVCGDMPLRGTGEESVPEIVRVAMTATDQESRLVVLRSYDEVLYSNPRNGKAASMEGQYTLATATAASCAAPVYFEPVGELHDGAFGGANNPSAVMSREVTNLSMLHTPRVDFLASFGTGRFTEKYSKHWLQLLKRGLERGLNAETLYEQYHMTLSASEQERHHRINPVFERAPISLDDVDSLDWVKKQTEEILEAGPDEDGCASNGQMFKTIQNLRLSLLASLFYGILLYPPYFDSTCGRYFAKIAIASRWEDNPTIKSELSRTLDTSHFLIEGTRFPYSTPLEITVTVACLKQPLDIRLSHNQRSYWLSGFPLSISEMIYLQGAKSLFTDPANKEFEGLSADSISAKVHTSWEASKFTGAKRHLPGDAENRSPRKRPRTGQ